MELDSTTKQMQYTPAPPSMSVSAYPPDSTAVDHTEYQPANPIAQPPPPYAHPQQQPQTANTNVSVVTVAQQPTTNLIAIADRPPNYLALSLVNLLCCCFPIGIAALIYSLRVDSEYSAGNYQEARRASNTARSLNIAGITVGIIIVVCCIIYVVVSVAVASS
ncbi:proline-rich transmembrane protein 1-like [Dysidea avara]|uniref:proline-rich transmembrane protein 1-like n=1 Tax=Dysidea avara TaxID=196820 RepID=UPI00332E892D